MEHNAINVVCIPSNEVSALIKKINYCSVLHIKYTFLIGCPYLKSCGDINWKKCEYTLFLMAVSLDREVIHLFIYCRCSHRPQCHTFCTTLLALFRLNLGRAMLLDVPRMLEDGYSSNNTTKINYTALTVYVKVCFWMLMYCCFSHITNTSWKCVFGCEALGWPRARLWGYVNANSFLSLHHHPPRNRCKVDSSANIP